MLRKPKTRIVFLLLISIAISITGCGNMDRHNNFSDVEDVNNTDTEMSQTDYTAIPSQNDDTTGDFDDSNGYYEYYLTKEELIEDIEQGYIFNLDTAFTKKTDTEFTEGENYLAPYVSQGNWPFYVHENNTINLEIAFSNLLTKPNNNIFPGIERIIVEVISPDEQSAYWFEKVGNEITEDTSIQEQISVTPGEWKLQISFAYVCGETPAHLKISATYETPSDKDINWLREERLNVQFDKGDKEGSAYVYNEESQISEIGLSFSLRNISPTGATLVFHQYNADAPKGELMFGEAFVIEVKKNDEWEKASISIEGNYGFNSIAMMIESESITQTKIDWEWLYGELGPGEYRIGKSVTDFIESGKYDEYMVYAHFILN